MRVFKIVLICASGIFIFFDFNLVHCMKDGKSNGKLEGVVIDMEVVASDASTSQAPESVRIDENKKSESAGVIVDLGREKFNTLRLGQYYHAESKTLDLSHKPMGDQGLKLIFDHIRHFVSENDTEILLLESMDLTDVPYYLITYALVDKHLKVVSFQNNKFNIPGLPVLEEGLFPSAAESAYLSMGGKRENKGDSTNITQMFQPVQAAAAPRVAGVVANIISTLWDSISPQIARELEAQNLSRDSLPMFKKIIFIDRRIPPITVFDQTQVIAPQPLSKCQKFKYAIERALYTIAGGIVAYLPQIIILISGHSGNSDTCDKDMLQKLMLACNSSAI